MNKFEEYLEAEGLGSETVYQHRKYAGYFIAWLAESSLAITQVTHAEMLDFADHLKKESMSINMINRMMLAVSYYFTWLQHDGQATPNPAAGIRLKGAVRNVPHDLLTKPELEALYESYTVKDERTHRNKVIIGLLVYQALTRDELHALRAEHLKLREGKIHIPQTGKLNTRILMLEPHQILELQEYQLLIRPKIIAEGGMWWIRWRKIAGDGHPIIMRLTIRLGISTRMEWSLQVLTEEIMQLQLLMLLQ